MLLRLVLIISLSCLVNTASIADEANNTKVDNIKKLFEVTGSVNIAKQFAGAVSQQMFKMLKASRPEIPDRALVVMNSELMSFLSEKMYVQNGLIDRVIPIYTKHFTDAEIKQLLDFYKTPLGQKTISVMPQIVNESLIVGQQWGQSLAPEMQRRVILALQREKLLPTEK